MGELKRLHAVRGLKAGLGKGCSKGLISGLGVDFRMGLGGWPTIPFPQMDGNKNTRRSFQQLSEKLSHRDMCETSQTGPAPFATWTPPGAGSQGTTDTVPWEEPMSTNPTTRSSGDLKHCTHTHTHTHRLAARMPGDCGRRDP